MVGGLRAGLMEEWLKERKQDQGSVSLFRTSREYFDWDSGKVLERGSQNGKIGEIGEWAKAASMAGVRD